MGRGYFLNKSYLTLVSMLLWRLGDRVVLFFDDYISKDGSQVFKKDISGL